MGEFAPGLYARIGYDHFMPEPLGGLAAVSKEAMAGIPAPYRASYEPRDWRDMGAMTTGFGDIEQLEYTRRLAHNRRRAEVARFGILSQAMYTGALSLVDASGTHTPNDVQTFF